MKNANKAFTLVELLAVIVILGIIAFLIFPNVNKTIEESKEKSYSRQVAILEQAAQKYTKEHIDEVSEENIFCIPIETLINSGYIAAKDKDNEGNYVVLNPKDNSKMNGLIVVEYDDNYRQYDYSYKNIHQCNASVLLTVTLDPNGGAVSPDNIQVKSGKKYGDLPTPTKDNEEFEGWYYNNQKVTADTYVNNTEDHTLIARWKDKIPPVLALTVSDGTTYAKSKTATVTISDNGGSGLPNTGVNIYYAWGTSAVACSSMTNYITITPTAGDNNVTGGIPISSGTGAGQLYICNKDAAITDRAGNSLASGTTMNADMYLDNDVPIIADSGLDNGILVEATVNEYEFSFDMYIPNNQPYRTKCKPSSSSDRDTVKRLKKFQLIGTDGNAIDAGNIEVTSTAGFGNESTSCTIRELGPFYDCVKTNGTINGFRYYNVTGSLLVTFKTRYAFNNIVIVPSYSGKGRCTIFGYQNFNFNLKAEYDKDTTKNCVIAHGKDSTCTVPDYNNNVNTFTSTTSTSCNTDGSNIESYTHSCPYMNKSSVTTEPLYGTGTGSNITVDAVGTPSKTFTVNFQDNESGLPDGESSKSCTTSDDNTCEITISDNVGNTKTYTCSAETDICS